MDKKRYFILSPSYDDDARMKDLQGKALNYYGQKDYEPVMEDPIFHEKVRNIVGDREDQNASLLLIGVIAMALAQCDSLYVSRDWEQDDVCKISHMLAFSHGLDIVYEPV